MPEPQHAYLFEAKGIQRYLFHGGRLRDVVGGSDLVAAITGNYADYAIGRLLNCDKFADVCVFSRKAGGAFCLHGPRDVLEKVRQEFRLKLMQSLPGLEFTDALGEGPDALFAAKDARAKSGAVRANSVASALPIGRPVFAIAPRTGLPSTAVHKNGDELDRVLVPQRARADEMAQQGGRLDGVTGRFHPAGLTDIRYPRNLDDDEDDTAANPLMPWRNGGDRRVGLVHADVSGLGQLYAQAGCTDPAAALALSAAIEDAMLRAVTQANAEVILPFKREREGGGFSIAPARPLVLGGDDMTVIVRADLALRFAARLLEFIETETKGLAAQFPGLKLPEALTACAGVAIARVGLPFLTMSALADSLCGYAKSMAKESALPNKPYASLLAFYVQTQTAEEDYGRDIKPGLGGLTGNPYRVGGYGLHLPCTDWAGLHALAKNVHALHGSGNSLRRIKSLLGNGRKAEADDIWHRMFSRTDRSADSLLRVIKAIAPDVSAHVVPACGALFDALDLIDLGAIDPDLGQEAVAV